MTNRRASIEATLGRDPPESPTPDPAPTHLDSGTTGAGTTDTGTTASIFRRRPLRAKSTSNASSSSNTPLWVDTDPGNSRKAKGARINARRASGVESPHNSASPQTSASEPDVPLHEKEKDPVGFLPKLSRILEGKESKALRRRRGSTISSIDDPSPTRRRRRPVEDAVTRRPIRQKHASLQRRAESLANLTNPSLISVLSGVTQQSSASSGSNSTITQKSYDKNHVSKRRPTKERKRLQTKQESQKPTEMAPEPPSVFQYMDTGLQHNAGSDGSSDVRSVDGHEEPLEQTCHEAPANRDWARHNESTSEQTLTQGSSNTRPSSSSSSASSRDSDSDDGNSSNAEEASGESPMTSPASTRMSGTAAIASSEARRLERGTHNNRDRYTSDSSFSVRESSPEPDQPEVYVKHQMHVEEPEDDEDEDSDSSGEDDDDDVDGDDERAANHEQMHGLALERAAPPRLPSTSSSRHSDPHTRRLRNQEQELREHVLQNPQPHRDFRYEGGPSPHAHTAMPLYDIHAYSGGSPDNYYDPVAQSPVWPPPAAPPPPQVGYYSPTYNAPPVPYYPGPENSYAMAARPPMTTVQQQPFYAHGQPPHYQQHPAGPDMTKTTVVGYELLADRLAEVPKDRDDKVETEGSAMIPMYRKFEQLNHRVLLHLQDEISELEEELRYLDECIAQSSPGAETGNPHPASRRGDSRYGGELHYRRTDLLGRIYLKLGQYNQALSSFSSMLKNLDPAKMEDIQAYRAWMKEHAPIEAAEARFLERKNDLLTVTRRRSADVGGVLTHQSAVIGYPLMAVLPLMAFAIVPSLLGRLFIIALIGGAEVMVVTSTELMDLLTVREWVICASM